MMVLIPNKLQETIDEQERRERADRIQRFVVVGVLLIATFLIIGTVGYLMGVNV